MSNELVHKKIEEHINTSMGTYLSGMKFSLNHSDARDYTLPGAPLLIEGVSPFLVFKVSITEGQTKVIGNTTRSRVGIVIVETYIGKEKSDRDFYKTLDSISEFLERQNVSGVRLENGRSSSEFTRGKWMVKPWSFEFKTTWTV